MKNSKLIFCALGFFLPGSGLNCFYLQGLKSFWAWVQLFALIGGIAGWTILRNEHFHSAPGWILLTFGFIAIEASWHVASTETTSITACVVPHATHAFLHNVEKKVKWLNNNYTGMPSSSSSSSSIVGPDVMDSADVDDDGTSELRPSPIPCMWTPWILRTLMMMEHLSSELDL